jgi:AcrR family transcriptional regulator
MARATSRQRNPRGHGERLREQLMDAAAEILREHGNAGAVSVRAVTARAGVSPTALYLHFAGVDELLSAVLERSFAELRRYLLAAESAHQGDADAQLMEMGRAYLAFAMEHPGHYATIFGPRTEPVEAAIKPQAGEDAFGDLVRAVSRCLRDDRDPHVVSASIWAEMHGIVTLRHAIPGFEWPSLEAMLEEVCTAHLRRPVGGSRRDAR